MKTQSSKDQSKASTTSSNASQLDDVLDSFFQANKFKQNVRPNFMRSNLSNTDLSKSIQNNKSDVLSSQAQCTQGISQLPHYLSSQKDLKNSERTMTTSANRVASNYYDSSSDDENIIEQFKQYSSVHSKQYTASQQVQPIPTHTNNYQNKNNLLCTQSQESNTPILSDIKGPISNTSSQANDNLPSQFSLNRQNSLQNKSTYHNGSIEIQRQNSLQKHSHLSSNTQQNQISKSSINNLKSSSLSGVFQRGSDEKTTVGKDSIDKSNLQTNSQKTGLSYLRNYQENQSIGSHEKSSAQKYNNSSPIMSMNEILNKHRGDRNSSQKKDGFMSNSMTSLGDKSNKSSLSKIWEDQQMEDENQYNKFSENDIHPYGQRLKISASVNISSCNRDQTNKDSQPLLQPKNIFNQNQIRKQQFEENESFGISNNSNAFNRSSLINFGMNTSNKNNQIMNNQKGQINFLSAQKEEFKKYESIYSKQSQGYSEDNNSRQSENQTPKKFSLQKISPAQKFSSQPLNNNYFQTLNLNNQEDQESDEDMEYLKNIAKSTSSQSLQQKQLASSQQDNPKNKLTLFKASSTPLPQISSNLTQILNQFKLNKQQSNSNNVSKNFSNQRTQSKIFFDNDSYYDEEEEEQRQVKNTIKRCNSSISTQKTQQAKNKKQQKKKSNLNSKRRRLIREDDDDYEDYNEVNQFFEEEAKSDGNYDDEYDEDDDFIDNKSNPYSRNKKKGCMRDFGDYESEEEEEDEQDKRRKNEKQSKYGAKLKKKLCIDENDDCEDDSTSFQGKKEKQIYLTEAKKKSKEEQKQKLNKEHRKRVVDSEESESDKNFTGSDKKKKSSSKKKNRNKKFDFSESDGAVDENDDYENDSFIDDESEIDDIFEDNRSMNLNSPSQNEDEDEIENKMFFSLADQKANNKKKKKLIKGANLGQIEQFLCSVCQENPSDSYFGEIDCFHRFCFGCIENWSQIANQCPICRKEFFKIVKRNFNGTVNNTKPIQVRRKKQKVNEEDFIQEAQAIQDEEDRAAFGDQGEGEAPENYEASICYKCGQSDKEHLLLICDVCDDNCCHTYCDENIRTHRVPEGRWSCHFCRPIQQQPSQQQYR